MLVLPVPDPRDLRCPLPVSEDRRNLLFFGTWSRGIPDPREEGFDPGRVPYRPEHVLRLLEIYEELQFDGELGGVTPRAILSQAAHAPARAGESHFAFFTPYYFTARNRAIGRPFGETVSGILSATEELRRLLSEPARRHLHWEHLRSWDDQEREHLARIPAPGVSAPQTLRSMRLREAALMNCRSPEYVAEALRKVLTIQEHYLTLHRGGNPVVYVVRSPPGKRTLPWWRETEEHGYVLAAYLPPQEILYRIDLSPASVEVPGTDPEILAELDAS